MLQSLVGSLNKKKNFKLSSFYLNKYNNCQSLLSQKFSNIYTNTPQNFNNFLQTPINLNIHNIPKILAIKHHLNEVLKCHLQIEGQAVKASGYSMTILLDSPLSYCNWDNKLTERRKKKAKDFGSEPNSI